MQALYQLSYSPAFVWFSRFPSGPRSHLRTRKTLAGQARNCEIPPAADPPPSGVVADHRLRQGARVVLQQPPAARALAEHRPAAVGEAAEALPQRRVQAQQTAEHGADGAAVADDHQGPVLGQLLGGLQHHRDGAVGDLGGQLPATAADRLALRPGLVLLGEAGADLGVGQALPVPRVRLAQALVVLDVQPGERGQLGGRTGGPLQVRGDQQVRAQPGEQPGRPLRLQYSLAGQLDVGGALEARFEVPGRLAVPPEDDARSSRLPAQLGSSET